jgi:hypothetical protein
MKNILGLLSAGFLYFCVGTVCTLFAGTAVLWQKGAFDDGRILKMWAALYGIDITAAPTSITGTETKNTENTLQEQPTYEEMLTKRALASLDISLRESALDKSIGELKTIESKIRTERTRFDSLVKSFDLKLQELETSASNQAIQETQATLEVLPPKQAKQQLLKLLADKPTAQLENPREAVVSLVKSMPIERRKKILAEFKTEEEGDKLAEILKDILSGAPDVPLLREARDNLDRVAPERQ